MHARFWWGSPKERDCLEDLRVDRKIILKWLLKREDGMAWSGDKCRGDVNKVMHIRVLSDAGNFLKS